jgi:hypothetical protein
MYISGYLWKERYLTGTQNCGNIIVFCIIIGAFSKNKIWHKNVDTLEKWGNTPRIQCQSMHRYSPIDLWYFHRELYEMCSIHKDLILSNIGRNCKQASFCKQHYVRFSWSYCVDRDSSVGIAIRYGIDGPGNECRWWWDIARPFRTALGPIQLYIQRVSALFPGGKAAGAWH